MPHVVPLATLACSLLLLAACSGSSLPASGPSPSGNAPVPTPVRTAAQGPALPATVPASPAPVGQRAGWKRYQNQVFGFEFQHPEACQVDQFGESFGVGGRIELAIVDAEGFGLLDYVNRLVAQKMAASDWKLQSQEATTVGETTAVSIEYRFGGTNRYGTARFVERQGRIYIWQLTAGGFTCDEPDVFDDVVSSFRFTR